MYLPASRSAKTTLCLSCRMSSSRRISLGSPPRHSSAACRSFARTIGAWAPANRCCTESSDLANVDFQPPGSRVDGSLIGPSCRPLPAYARFVAASLLEETGFEPSVSSPTVPLVRRRTRARNPVRTSLSKASPYLGMTIGSNPSPLYQHIRSGCRAVALARLAHQRPCQPVGTISLAACAVRLQE